GPRGGRRRRGSGRRGTARPDERRPTAADRARTSRLSEVVELELDAVVVRVLDRGRRRFDLRNDPLVERGDLQVLPGDVPVEAAREALLIPGLELLFPNSETLIASERLKRHRVKVVTGLGEENVGLRKDRRGNTPDDGLEFLPPVVEEVVEFPGDGVFSDGNVGEDI